MIDPYFWPTPNGKKVAVFLEESGLLPYRLIPLNISRGNQFSTEVLAVNPNHRMPAIGYEAATAKAYAATFRFLADHRNDP
jgi:GSH-dependent disulfide-bond oxidoreductase